MCFFLTSPKDMFIDFKEKGMGMRGRYGKMGSKLIQEPLKDSNPQLYLLS